jgi:hypothetical protein
VPPFRSYGTRNEAEAAYATHLHHDKKKAQGRSCRKLDLEGCTDMSSVCTYFSFVLQIDVIGLCCWTFSFVGWFAFCTRPGIKPSHWLVGSLFETNTKSLSLNL